MVEIEFDKEHTNWLHGEDKPEEQDLDQVESDSEAGGG